MDNDSEEDWLFPAIVVGCCLLGGTLIIAILGFILTIRIN